MINESSPSLFLFMLDLPNVLLVITGLLNAGMVFFVLSKNERSQTSVSFAYFAVFLSFWSASILFFRLLPPSTPDLYMMKVSYISATLLAANFLCFSLSFPSKELSVRTKTVIILPALLFSLVLLVPDFLTKSIIVHPWGKEVVLGWWEFLVFSSYFLTMFIGALIYGWLKYFRAQGIVRLQLLFVVLSVTLAGGFGVFFNLILPSIFFHNFKWIWTGPLFTSVIAVTILYAIFRHKLFNAKVIAAELLTFSLWVFIFVRTILSDTSGDQLINGSLLVVVIIVGTLLVRSVQREVETREQIERLALDLEQANEKLKEFDRLKSEFLSMGTHQLRSPLTAIKGYASLIMEGSFGKVPKSIEEAVDRIYQSSRSMANTIEDFLTISRIEQNRMKYDFAVADLGKIVKDVMAELLPNAIKAGLQLTYVDDKKGPYNANVDLGKIRQVIINFLDNAMKYTPKGSITLRVGRNDATKKILVSFVDTGVGMTPETISRLFQRFSRADDANKTNVMGTGLGLFVAKEMVSAHKGGRVWAESEGPGKGSQFYIELDAA